MNRSLVTGLLLMPATVIVLLTVWLGWSWHVFMAVWVGGCVLLFAVQVYLRSQPETGHRPQPFWKTAPKRAPRSLWTELRRRHLHGDYTAEEALSLVALLLILGVVLMIPVSDPRADLAQGGLWAVVFGIAFVMIHLEAVRRRFFEREAAALSDPVRAAKRADELDRHYRRGERLSGTLALLALAYARLERYADAERVAREALAAADRQTIRVVTPALDNPFTIARRALDEARHGAGLPIEEPPIQAPKGWELNWRISFGIVMIAGALLVSLTTLNAIVALLLVGIVAVPVLFVAWRWILPAVRLNRPGNLLTRIQSGDYLAVLSEVKGEWEAGKQTPINATLIAMATLHDRRPADAEPFARQARDMIHARGLHQQNNLFARWVAENAALALHNALLRQGRYGEAADALRERLPFTAYPAAITALIIWALFLGGDMDGARALLDRGQAQDGKRDQLPEPYRLARAYVQHKLSGTDLLPVQAPQESLSFWQDEVARCAGTPYGERLQTALEEMRAMVEA